jgi:glycosyltransferase involved in cell wall biosynthesis
LNVLIDARSIVTSEREVLPQGGVGRYLHQLLLHFRDLAPDIEFTLIVPDNNRRPILEFDNFTEISVPFRSNTWRSMLRLASRIDQQKFHLFHAPHNILPMGIRCPTVATIHDIMWLTNPNLCARWSLGRLKNQTLYGVGIRRALERSRHIFTVSNSSRGEIERIAPTTIGRIAVTHHGVDPAFAELPSNRVIDALTKILPSNSPFVLMIGQGSPYKNHARAIRAFQLAFDDKPEVKLVLVRRFQRRDPQLDMLLANDHSGGQVIVLDEIDEEKLRALYASAHVFLQPSLMEGFGMPLLEAMASGTAVLTSDRGAMAEVTGDAALLVNPLSVDAMAAALRRLFDDDCLRASLVASGRQRVKAFSWKTSAEQTIAIYRRVIDQCS